MQYILISIDDCIPTADSCDYQTLVKYLNHNLVAFTEFESKSDTNQLLNKILDQKYANNAQRKYWES